MLANPNPDDFMQGREAQADEQLLVRFFLKPRQDQEATMAEGRPIFNDTEYVEIRIPGKRDVQACRPATHQDKQRFNKHYSMFKQRIEAPESGTPLTEWPQIGAAMAAELSFMSIKTVEQLAKVSDGDISRVRGGAALKQRAADFLEFSDHTKLIAEKEALESRLTAQDEEMAELKGMVKAMQAMIASNKPAAQEVDDESEASTPRSRRNRKAVEAPPAIEE